MQYYMLTYEDDDEYEEEKKMKIAYFVFLYLSDMLMQRSNSGDVV